MIAPTLHSTRYGAGLDLFDPATHLEMDWRASRVSNAGGRQWDTRPSWHGVVYGNGKPGTGTESVIGPEALRSWPVVFDENGKLAKPPADSKHHGAVVTTAAKPRPYRRRRSSAQLTADVIDLHERGLVPVAIANQLNVSDRRIKAILAQAVAA